MTENDAIELFENAHSIHEQLDLEKDIRNVKNVLFQNNVDIRSVRIQIDIVNCKHPENTLLFNLIFPPDGNRVSLDAASDGELINDLKWKYDYLLAKRAGKTFAEFYKEMRKNLIERKI